MPRSKTAARRDDTVSIFQRYLRGLTYEQCGKTKLPWRDRRSSIVGASCWLLAVPSFMLQYQYPTTAGTLTGRCFQFAWIVTAAASFSSDYYWSGIDSFAHTVDTFLAAFMLIAMGILFLTNLRPEYALLGGIPVLCFYHSKKAQMNLNWNGYVVYHSVWHLSCAIVTSAYWFLLDERNHAT